MRSPSTLSSLTESDSRPQVRHAARSVGRPVDATSRDSAPATARFVLCMLERIRYGTLTVELPDGRSIDFGEPRQRLQQQWQQQQRQRQPNDPPSAGAGPRTGAGAGGSGSGIAAAATLRVEQWRVFRDTLSSGDIGFGEGYMRGDWSTPDLAALLRVFVANRDAIDAAIYGRWWGRMLHRLRHLLNRNTRARARRNVAAHYDLGNSFYRVWLDPSMTYSSALFEGDASRSLEQAQMAKYDRVLSRIELRRGAHVLEIGSGWGGFAERAAAGGLRVTGLTLSNEQLAYASERLARAGLAENARFLLQDYRDTHARFDAIVSIEMFEAVGEAYWPDYFACLRRNLAPHGRAVVQTIVIDDALFERYRAGTDFIQQYVFPGGMLPSPRTFEAEASRQGLRIVDRHAFGADYARTLCSWRASFLARLPEFRAQGFDTAFVRMWEFYLAYCEAGFAQGDIDVLQFTLEREA